MRECCPVFVGREKAQFGTNFYWTNLAPVLLDQFLLDQFGTNSTGPILLTLPVLLDQFYSPTTSF